MSPEPMTDARSSGRPSLLSAPATSFILKVVLAVSSVLLTYAVADIAYRIYRYEKITSLRTPFFAINTPLYAFDADIGYRYRHSSTLRFTHLDAENKVLQTTTVRVNNLGHVSPTDDTLAKLPAEFRIAILGDSFTASLHNNIPWPALLQDLLDSDRDLKRHLGASKVKVVNFGMDGTGLVQFARVYEREVRRYEPDVVVVNFISSDIMRKFIWRTTVDRSATSKYQLTLTCSSLPTVLDNRDCAFFYGIVLHSAVRNDRRELSLVRREIGLQLASRFTWVSFRPELLARLTEPLGLPLTSRLNESFSPLYETEAAAVDASLEAVRFMKARHRRLLVTHNPTYEELLSEKLPRYAQELMGRGASLGIVRMASRLPQTPDRTEIRRWFNAHDQHFSDDGAVVYARAMYNTVREFLATP